MMYLHLTLSSFSLSPSPPPPPRHSLSRSLSSSVLILQPGIWSSTDEANNAANHMYTYTNVHEPARCPAWISSIICASANILPNNLLKAFSFFFFFFLCKTHNYEFCADPLTLGHSSAHVCHMCRPSTKFYFFSRFDIQKIDVNL